MDTFVLSINPVLRSYLSLGDTQRRCAPASI